MLDCVSGTLCKDDKMYFTKTEIGLGKSRISIEFALHGQSFMTGVAKKENTKKNLSTILCLL